MTLSIKITRDSLQIEGNKPIRRPPWISRTRWLAWWKHVDVTGLHFVAMGRFLTGRNDLTEEQLIEIVKQRAKERENEDRL